MDDRKLRRAVETYAPAPRTIEDDWRDLKMVGAFIAAPLLLGLSLLLLLLELLARL